MFGHIISGNDNETGNGYSVEAVWYLGDDNDG